jgi:hypothetical protein
MPSEKMEFFEYGQLPPVLQAISKPVGLLAVQMDVDLPDCEQKELGLQHLIAAKDCFVRAKVQALKAATKAAE